MFFDKCRQFDKSPNKLFQLEDTWGFLLRDVERPLEGEANSSEWESLETFVGQVLSVKLEVLQRLYATSMDLFDNPSYLVRCGLDRMLNNKFDVAEQFFERAISKDATYAHMAHYNLSRALLETSCRSGSGKVFFSTLRHFPRVLRVFVGQEIEQSNENH